MAERNAAANAARQNAREALNATRLNTLTARFNAANARANRPQVN